MFYYEDFEEGCVFESVECIVFVEEIIVFVIEFDFQLMYFDEVVGKVSIFGGFFGFGWYMSLIVMCFFYDSVVFCMVGEGGFGVDVMEWCRFFIVGDMVCLMIRVKICCLFVFCFGIGFVIMEYMMMNQKGEWIMCMEVFVFICMCNQQFVEVG